MLIQATYLQINLQKQKRKLRKATLVSKGDFKRIRHLLDNIK